MSSDEVEPPKKSKSSTDNTKPSSTSSCTANNNNTTHSSTTTANTLQAPNNQLSSSSSSITTNENSSVHAVVRPTNSTASSNSNRSQSTTTELPSSRRSSSNVSTYNKNLNDESEWVYLNVGGTVLVTTRTTLTNYSDKCDHFLARLISQSLPSRQDRNGAYLIDRNPDFFKYVINYLRNGRLDTPSEDLLEGILSEAEFCNLPFLIKICKRRIDKRNLERAADTPMQKRVIYRVLQSSAQELTQMISTLSESWRLEQILNLETTGGSSHHHNSHTGHGNEYLVVVSQEHDEEVQTPRRSNYSNGTFSNCNEKVKALSGSLSAHTITNIYR